MSKRVLWVVETSDDGEWIPHLSTISHIRDAARVAAKYFGNAYGWKTRVVKYVPA